MSFLQKYLDTFVYKRCSFSVIVLVPYANDANEIDVA